MLTITKHDAHSECVIKAQLYSHDIWLILSIWVIATSIQTLIRPRCNEVKHLQWRTKLGNYHIHNFIRHERSLAWMASKYGNATARYECIMLSFNEHQTRCQSMILIEYNSQQWDNIVDIN